MGVNRMKMRVDVSAQVIILLHTNICVDTQFTNSQHAQFAAADTFIWLRQSRLQDDPKGKTPRSFCIECTFEPRGLAPTGKASYTGGQKHITCYYKNQWGHLRESRIHLRAHDSRRFRSERSRFPCHGGAVGLHLITSIIHGSGR